MTIPSGPVPWPETVVYELHTRGFTRCHREVPEHQRGTYAGLAHPAVLDHLVGLGVTAVELLPVHAFVSETHLHERGRRNYWGYNSIGFFAPHGAYSSTGTRGQQVREFKEMVRALHAAGLEVILDVVYNHTSEQGVDGPVLSYRGIDERAYYRHGEGAHAQHYVDVTGCGNTLDTRTPQVLALVLDSLRYWVTQMHVDGFRFDLAPALARATHGFDPRGAFLAAVGQDPVLSTVKLIAEPWDCGEGGYAVGRFPAPWAEWNDRYRNTVRDFWRSGHGGQGGAHGIRDLGSRLSGSSDLYRAAHRRPYASVNFVTAHDGFTARDLVSYNRKHNEANGEHNRDGTEDNRSWNCGVEGETDDPAVLELRLRQVRNLLATLLLSTGVPMLTAGDEMGRTQRGNNNAYCQDDETSWVDWHPAPAWAELRGFVASVLALRRAHPVLRQDTFFDGRTTPGGRKDIAWLGTDGAELPPEAWHEAHRSTLGVYVAGDGIRSRGPQGGPVTDDSFLLLLDGGPVPVTYRLPGLPWGSAYDVVLDTARPDRPSDPPDRLVAGGEVTLVPRSLLLLRAVP